MSTSHLVQFRSPRGDLLGYCHDVHHTELVTGSFRALETKPIVGLQYDPPFKPVVKGFDIGTMCFWRPEGALSDDIPDYAVDNYDPDRKEVLTEWFYIKIKSRADYEWAFDQVWFEPLDTPIDELCPETDEGTFRMPAPLPIPGTRGRSYRYSIHLGTKVFDVTPILKVSTYA